MDKKYINLLDEELVKGCLDHNEKYFSVMFHKYYSKMFYVCSRYASSHEEADDMTQEGFIMVFKKINTFGFNGSFEGWMRKVMVNNSINYLKSHRKLKFMENIEDTTVQHEIEELSLKNEEIKDFIPADKLMNLIQELSPVYHVIFNLYAIDGFSHKEIAEKLNITESTSRANLTKARLKLKKSVEDLLIKERASYA